MGLPATFPWQCSALVSTIAVILAAIACGIPMWSQWQNQALPVNSDYEYGMWEACVITNGNRRCGTPWHATAQPCYATVLAFRIIGCTALAFLALGMLLSCALFKSPKKALCLAVAYIFFFAVVLMCVTFGLWIGLAESPLCGFFGEPLRNYGPSFIMWVVATALASMAMCLTCFGALGALKKLIPGGSNTDAAHDPYVAQEMVYADSPYDAQNVVYSSPYDASYGIPKATYPGTFAPPTYYAGGI